MHLLDLDVEMLRIRKHIAIVLTFERVKLPVRNQALFLLRLLDNTQIATHVLVWKTIHIHTLFATVVPQRLQDLLLLSSDLTHRAFNSSGVFHVCEFFLIDFAENVRFEHVLEDHLSEVILLMASVFIELLQAYLQALLMMQEEFFEVFVLSHHSEDCTQFLQGGDVSLCVCSAIAHLMSFLLNACVDIVAALFYVFFHE